MTCPKKCVKMAPKLIAEFYLVFCVFRASLLEGYRTWSSLLMTMFSRQIETVCVPILRSDDNCSCPKVGTPWSTSVFENFEDVVDAKRPNEPRYKVSAYAGPMSPQEVIVRSV